MRPSSANKKELAVLVLKFTSTFDKTTLPVNPLIK
jgi:hypothetical protein